MTTLDADGNWHEDEPPEDPHTPRMTLVTDGDAFSGRVPSVSDALAHCRAFLSAYLVLPDAESLTAVTLWAAHAHVMTAWDSTPRLAFMSPEKRSGKSRAQEVLETVVPNPLRSSTVTSAVLYRRLSEDPPPTVFMDEVDAVWTGKGVAEELRAVVNAGHRRGNNAHRMVGEGSAMKAQTFCTFGALCLAGIGELPDTIADRSVIVRMRRKLPTETVERWRFRSGTRIGDDVRQHLAAALAPLADNLADATPEIPPDVEDRAADVWEPLLALADEAGGDWPAMARRACAVMTASEGEATSTGVKLLTDLRDIWDKHGAPEIATADLLTMLHRHGDERWGGDYPITAKRLANIVKRYGIKPAHRKDWRGYVRADFTDAWQRYCPRTPPGEASPRVTSVTRRETCRACGDPMTVTVAGQTAHPTCRQEDE